MCPFTWTYHRFLKFWIDEGAMNGLRRPRKASSQSEMTIVLDDRQCHIAELNELVGTLNCLQYLIWFEERDPNKKTENDSCCSNVCGESHQVELCEDLFERANNDNIFLKHCKRWSNVGLRLWSWDYSPVITIEKQKFSEIQEITSVKIEWQ